MEHSDKVSETYKMILDMVNGGLFKVSEKIHSESKLAKQFKVSKSSVNRAIKIMHEKGIVSRNRSGTFVSRQVTDNDYDLHKEDPEKKVFVLYTMADDVNLHWGERALSALESILKEKGFSLIFKEIKTSITEKEFLGLFHDIMRQGPEAIVISASGNIIPRHLDNLKNIFCELNAPLYLHDRPGSTISHLPFHSVALDPFNSGLVIGRLLRENGHKETYFLINPTFKNHQWVHLRYEGVKAGLVGKKQLHINVPMLETNIDLFDKIADSTDNPVVISLNNLVGATFIDRAREKGLNIPEDYQLISFDDHPSWFSYNISSLKTPQEKIGRLLARLIINKSTFTENGNTVSVRVYSEYIERQTFKSK